jgi:hypothetical protein
MEAHSSMAAGATKAAAVVVSVVVVVGLCCSSALAAAGVDGIVLGASVGIVGIETVRAASAGAGVAVDLEKQVGKWVASTTRRCAGCSFSFDSFPFSEGN